MYGRSGRGYVRRGRGGGPGYAYGRDSYRPSQEPWMSPYDGPDRGSGYFDRPKRGYSGPKRGYRGPRKQRPPHHAPPWGRGDPRGGFRGKFRPSRPVRGARPPNQPPFAETNQFQQLRPFVDNFYFGGGFKMKERRWKREGSSKYEREQSPAKRMKMSAENNDNAEEPAQSTVNDGEQEAGTQEETEHTQSSSEKHQETQMEMLNNNLMNRIQFFCTLCKFRTFYEEAWNIHQQSDFHKELCQKMYEHVPKTMAGFFEAYVENSYKKAKYNRKQVEDLNAKILQVYRNRDLTLGLCMDHFMKKVAITHCGACDIFLPMRLFSLKKHIKSASHKNNCKHMMNVSQEIALKTAMSILENKRNKHRLELYTNGENPFIYYDENFGSGCSRELAAEGEDSGEVPCITLSDSEGEEDDDFQGQDSFINDEEEEEEIRSDYSTEVVPETEETEQMPCSPPPDTERDEEEEEEEEEEDCDEVAEQETAYES